MSKLRLTGTQKLQVVLSGAATASRVTVSYMDFTATGVTGGTQLSVTNGATPVDICAAPAASTTRQIDHIKLVAKATMTPTFSVNDGTAEEWETVTLATGDTFDWGSGGGVVRDSSGQLKSVMPGYFPLTGGTVSGLITANAGISIPTGQTLTLTGATVAGAPTWSSSQAITLSTAAQPNVTSLGTLTGLNTGLITNTVISGYAATFMGGNVGIGTTSPNGLLTLYPSSGANTQSLVFDGSKAGVGGAGIMFKPTNGSLSTTNNIGAGIFFTTDSGAGTLPSSIRFAINNAGTYGEAMRITSTGKVGIGTTNPGSKLSIVGLPTSSAGLTGGDIWLNSNVLTIVP